MAINILIIIPTNINHISAISPVEFPS
jgi:hypothetical protein